VVVLMDDALALELGAPILAAAPYVGVRADGAKKSISGPGAGNYLTVAEAVAATRAILGDERLRRRGMVQAHGTGTPQNRVTESTLLSKVAQAYGVDEWPVAAIKSYVGHSLGAAAGDQLTAMLGIWQYNRVPRIQSIDAIAEDVVTERLAFALDERGSEDIDYALINSKGFGGNNATAALLSPLTTEALLAKHHGQKAMTAWRRQQAASTAAQDAIEASRLSGQWSPLYRFDEGVLTDADVTVTDNSVLFGDRAIRVRASVPEEWRIV
jgi:acetoacetyl-[acyl-carrier protein] synthase